MVRRAVDRLASIPNPSAKRLTREAIQVDIPQQLEEPDAMFRILREVLVDHVQCRLENCVQNGRDLWSQQMLKDTKRLSIRRRRIGVGTYSKS